MREFVVVRAETHTNNLAHCRWIVDNVGKLQWVFHSCKTRPFPMCVLVQGSGREGMGAMDDICRVAEAYWSM